MKKLLIGFSLTWFLSLSISAVAGIIGDLKITGKVLKYNKNTVTLSYAGKKKITVPRSKIDSSVKLKSGKIVTAVYSGEEVMELIKEQSADVKEKTDRVVKK